MEKKCLLIKKLEMNAMKPTHNLENKEKEFLLLLCINLMQRSIKKESTNLMLRHGKAGD
jgi:hypothetical protein